MINIFRWFFLGLMTVLTAIPYYLYTGIVFLIKPKQREKMKPKGKPIIPIVI